jgi:apolipoprotein N-acyltransferase
MTTLLIAAIVILLVIALAARINIVREATLALVLAAGLLWIIGNHGGDVHAWAPYVVGFMFAGAAIRWCYTLFGHRPV